MSRLSSGASHMELRMLQTDALFRACYAIAETCLAEKLYNDKMALSCQAMPEDELMTLSHC